jgi:uncharacterized membrane protein YfhO
VNAFRFSASDMIYIWLCAIGALLLLFAIVYAVARLVFYWLPVGCTP